MSKSVFWVYQDIQQSPVVWVPQSPDRQTEPVPHKQADTFLGWNTNRGILYPIVTATRWKLCWVPGLPGLHLVHWKEVWEEAILAFPTPTHCDWPCLPLPHCGWPWPPPPHPPLWPPEDLFWKTLCHVFKESFFYYLKSMNMIYITNYSEKCRRPLLSCEENEYVRCESPRHRVAYS